MNKLLVATAVTLFAANLAFAKPPAKDEPAAPSMPAAAAAAGDCESKAVGKNGKPLHGAAKAAFMKKCTGGMGPVGAAKDKTAKQ